MSGSTSEDRELHLRVHLRVRLHVAEQWHHRPLIDAAVGLLRVDESLRILLEQLAANR
jgi:hypothetical protein